MSWRPAPAVRNPLVALRRVVERPEIEHLDVGVQTSSEHVPVPAAHASGHSGEGPRGTGARGRRGHPHPPRPQPDRPVQALITSTPVEHTPARRPHAAGHAPAGPWSTLPGAPPTTPTLLRGPQAGHPGGSTATATGRTATVITYPAAPPARPAPPGQRPAAPDPTPAPPAPSPGSSREATAGRPTIAAPGVAPSAAVARATARAAVIPDALPAPVRSRPGAPARRHMTVIQVVAAMATALLAWSLLDAPALLHGAETAPLGARRTAALDVLRPLERVSAALSLDRVSHSIDHLLHRHTPSSDAAPPPLPTAPAATAPTGGGSTTATTTPTSTTAAPGLPPLRMGTAADPLRVLVIGDSIGLSFGYSMANKLDAGGIVKTTVDGREGTGLTRPDAFDWSAEVRADIVQFHPELVVAMFGGNDDQDTIVNGRFIPFGGQAWTVIYGARVAGVAATVHSAGAHLLWAGLPVMRSAGLTQRLQAVMAVTKAALGGRDGVAFVDNVAALSDGSGHYTVALPGSNGQEVIVREPDGVHLTPAGADRLADRAITTMQQSWRLVVHTPPAAP